MMLMNISNECDFLNNLTGQITEPAIFLQFLLPNTLKLTARLLSPLTCDLRRFVFGIKILLFTSLSHAIPAGLVFSHRRYDAIDEARCTEILSRCFVLRYSDQRISRYANKSIYDFDFLQKMYIAINDMRSSNNNIIIIANIAS